MLEIDDHVRLSEAVDLELRRRVGSACSRDASAAAAVPRIGQARRGERERVARQQRERAADSIHLTAPCRLVMIRPRHFGRVRLPTRARCARGVEQPLVVADAHLVARVGRERRPQRRVEVVDVAVRVADRRRDASVPNRNRSGYRLIRAAATCDRLRRRDDVLRDLVPRDVEVQIAKRGIGEHATRAIGQRDALHRAHDRGPTPVCAQMIVVVRMAPEAAPSSASRYAGVALSLRERHVHVAVQQHEQPDLAGEGEDAVERGIEQARGLAGDLRRRRIPCGS